MSEVRYLAVRTGISQQLLFVEALGVVKGLLRRIAENAVCLPLQGGQVIEFWGLFLLFLTGDGGTHRRSAGTHRLHRMGILRRNDLLRNCLCSIHLQAHMVVSLFLGTA